MKLIIDIDKDIAQGIIDGKGEMPRNIVRSFQATIADAIKNGTPLSEELEKLKTEFIKREGVFTSYHFVKAIDKHISELKGNDNQ